MVKASGIIKIIRPVNCIMMSIAILIGAILGGVKIIPSSMDVLVYGIITGFLMTGSAMAINDYYDREIDAINEPMRPIPSGAVSPTEALIITAVLSAIGLIASWKINTISLGVAIYAWVAMVVYSTIGKKTGLPGNLIVSSCIALPFIYGEIISGGVRLGTSLIFGLIAFLANTGREVTKGIVDIDGDTALGINTVAVKHGEKTAAWVSMIFYLSAVLTSVVPLLMNVVSLWYVPLVFITDIGLLFLSVSLLKNPNREYARKVKNRVLMLMLCGLIGFMLGSLL
jgi:geranylgeranylglycerol-phosphate geranylgeranyltransferase